MKCRPLSVRRLFYVNCIGLLFSMAMITLIAFSFTLEGAVLIMGAAEAVCALVWFFVLAQSLGKRLSRFACELCDTLDNMMDGGEAPETSDNSEALLARISHRLTRLYKIMQENRRRVEEERRELQALVSDISHQVKTPVGNLKVAADTLLTRTLTDAERSGFIKGIRSQADKLDFLVQALVKTSRLETGVICLEKKTALFMIPSPRR